LPRWRICPALKLQPILRESLMLAQDVKRMEEV
jgi:hypothetical protein